MNLEVPSSLSQGREGGDKQNRIWGRTAKEKFSAVRLFFKDAASGSLVVGSISKTVKL